MAKGQVTYWNDEDEFGYIKPDGAKLKEENARFRWSNVRGIPRESLSGRPVVEFTLTTGRNGKPMAQDVRLAGTATASPAPQRTTERRVQVNAPNTGADTNLFLNPYNFVRYLPAPDLSKVKAEDQIAAQLMTRCPPPPHDRYVGLTGRIVCRVTAKTPLFVSDSHDVKDDPDYPGHKIYRFFEYEGKAAIPATSLRGMVRSVFEAVTNSCFAVFDDGGFDQRGGELPRGIVAARVVSVDESGAKLERLDCSQGYPPEARVHERHGKLVPLMNAASVPAYEEHVLDAETKETFDPSRSRIPKDVRDGERVAALVKLTPVNNKIYQYFEVDRLVPYTRAGELQVRPGMKKVFGYIHITGPNIEKKHEERLFFRWDDRTPEPLEWAAIPKQYRVEVDSKTVEDFNEHLREYWKRNQRFVERLDKKGQPWPITADDLPHPSYFIRPGQALKSKDVVYYVPNSRKGIPLLRTVLIARLPYQYSRKDLLPDEMHHCEKYDALCPACRMFGWVADTPEKDARRTAYAGRVRFTHAKLTEHGDKGVIKETTLAILSSPKPTTTLFYLGDKDLNPAQTDYDDEKARLRGRKAYREQGKEDKAEYERAGKVRDDQNRTIHNARLPGNVFEFSIDFENLAKTELGALLWSLELDEGMNHRLGFAKPLGFGSVKVEITQLDILDRQARYEELQPGWTPELESKGKVITAFKEALSATHNKGDFEKLNNVRDLKALLSAPKLERVHYPRPTCEPQVEGQNFDWFIGNKRSQMPQMLPLPSGDEAQYDEPGLRIVDRKSKTISC